MTDEVLIELWDDLGTKIRSAAEAGGQPESRTTLILALAGGGLLRWAAMGDSILALISADGEVTRLDQPRSHFVGYPMTRDEVSGRLQHGFKRLADGSWIVLATDGLTDFVDDVKGTLRAAAADAPDASAMVERLIDAASAGGAGDNIAALALRAVVNPVPEEPDFGLYEGLHGGVVDGPYQGAWIIDSITGRRAQVEAVLENGRLLVRFEDNQSELVELRGATPDELRRIREE